ncbi:hypothetical protein [Marinicellulosiphila megalodicopiae]|uniref:hypothetical protein n=1 Tax=Marinicellulosiphila megalodicopiae TaxID=2724896 RepID=UPI003BAF555A
MTINWQQKDNIIIGSCPEKTEYPVNDAVATCIEQAASILDKTIQDESQFFLLEWNKTKCELSIVVTDTSKTKDSEFAVKCHFDELEKIITSENEIEWIENVQVAASNYLTTCPNFLKFSLIAVFTHEDRNYCRLL